MPGSARCPSQADNAYRIDAAAGGSPAGRSRTSWRSRAVPPVPPANNRPPRTSGHRPVARGKPGVPYRTTVGRPPAICQPGMVTLSQPRADAEPASAPGFSSRLLPGGAGER